jgi:O-antigen/teichoic acid export membrane protein
MRTRVLGGVAWKALSQVVLVASRVAVALILARLLTPHEYGLAGMVLVFSTLIFIFSDLALTAALVRRPKLTEADRSTAFWTSLAVGAGFTVVGVGLAGPIAAFYGEPDVRPLFAVLSLSFLVTAVGTTQAALLTREMDFRSLELRKIAGVLAGAATGIATAAEGYGAWAIIVQQLTQTVVSVALLWSFSPWRPRLLYSLGSLRQLAGFSLKVFSTQLLFYANRNTDNLLIGRFLGAAALGAYALAYNVMLFPFSRIASPLQEVLFPAFARMQGERERLADAWLRVNRAVAAISVPALIGMVIVAPEFVSVVVGDRWAPAVPVLQILAWVGLLQSLQRLNSSLLQACDRAGTLLRFSLVSFAASIAAFAIGLRWGIVGVAACYAIANALLQPLYAWLTARTVGVSLGRYTASLAGVFQAALVMAACALTTRLLLVHEGAPAAATLAAVVLVGATTYVACCFWRAPQLIGEARDLFQGRRAAAMRAEPAKP